MNLYKDNYWVCDNCGFEYEEYGPQYECPSCGSDDIELDIVEDEY